MYLHFRYIVFLESFVLFMYIYLLTVYPSLFRIHSLTHTVSLVHNVYSDSAVIYQKQHVPIHTPKAYRYPNWWMFISLIQVPEHSEIVWIRYININKALDFFSFCFSYSSYSYIYILTFDQLIFLHLFKYFIVIFINTTTSFINTIIHHHQHQYH